MARIITKAATERAKKAATSAMVSLHCLGWTSPEADLSFIVEAKASLRLALKELGE